MILAFDTYYFENKAKTVCLAFEDWAEKSNWLVFDEILENIEEYVPGAFYKRELPCILSLFQKITCPEIEAVVVDGFVFLDDESKLGLGGHLYHSLGGKIPVIGVAKTNFMTINSLKYQLLRGASTKPLYITSIGMELDDAASKVKCMYGEFRIPLILKELDRMTKDITAE